MDAGKVLALVDRATALIEGTSGAQLMDAAGLSWQSLNAWKKRRRHPTPPSLERFGQVLEERGGELQEVGRELVEAAQEVRRAAEAKVEDGADAEDA